MPTFNETSSGGSVVAGSATRILYYSNITAGGVICSSSTDRIQITSSSLKKSPPDFGILNYSLIRLGYPKVSLNKEDRIDALRRVS